MKINERQIRQLKKLSPLLSGLALLVVVLAMYFATDVFVSIDDSALSTIEAPSQRASDIRDAVTNIQTGVYSSGDVATGATDTESGDTSSGTEVVDTSSSDSVSLKTTTSGNGKLITNDYGLPFYDDLTLDSEKLGCEAWKVPIKNNTDPVVRLAASKKAFTKMRYSSVTKYRQYSVLVDNSYVYSHRYYRMIDGRLLIALGPGVYLKQGESVSNSIVGRFCDVVLDDGTVIACVIGDAKGADGGYLDSNKMVHGDSSIMETITSDTTSSYEITGGSGNNPHSTEITNNKSRQIDYIVMYDYNILNTSDNKTFNIGGWY